MCHKFPMFAGLLLLFSLFTGGLRADPIIGPAVVQNGLRFQSWLASPKIVIPSKTIDYNHSIATMLFSVRVTNLTQQPVRFDPFAASLRIIKPNGEELGAGLVIGGYVRQPQEADYLLLQPGQSVILPCLSHLYWYNNGLCLDWPSPFIGHPMNYGGLIAGSYHFVLNYRMPNQTVAIRDDRTAKIVKTLNGFWTGDVMVASMTFEVTEPIPARASPPLPKREGPEQ